MSVVFLLAAVVVASPAPRDRHAHAFAESLRREKAQDIAGARDALTEVYGEAPRDYDAAMRLGWLSLNLGEPARASAHYERALAAAPEGPAAEEARLGLASAEKLRLTQPVVSPSVWGSYVTKEAPLSTGDGWSVSLTLPVHITPRITARAAMTYTEMFFSPTTATRIKTLWRSTDFFAGVGGTWGALGVEALGLALTSSDLVPVYGGDVRAWWGRRFGVTAEAAALSLPIGWNRQGSLTAFLTPWPWLSIYGGPRATQEPRAYGVSGFAGLTLGTLQRLHVSGHAGGEERWHVTGALPAVSTFREPSPWGAGASLIFTVAGYLELGFHASVSALRITDPVTWSSSEGRSHVFAAGLRYYVTPRKEPR